MCLSLPTFNYWRDTLKEGLAVVVGIDHPEVDIRGLPSGPDVAATRVVDMVDLKSYLAGAIGALDQLDVGLADEHERVIFLAGLQLADGQVTIGTGEHDLQLAALFILRFRLEGDGQ